MALIKCPECGKEFSDKALACPNCGCPVSEIKKQEEEERQKRIVSIQLEGTYSLKYDGDSIEIYSSNIFVFSAPKEEFVLNYNKEEQNYGRDQLRIVFSHKCYAESFIICVNKESERYENSKWFSKDVADKYFIKDIQEGYFNATSYARNHADKNLAEKVKRETLRTASSDQNTNDDKGLKTDKPNTESYAYTATEEKKKRGCCGIPVWVIGWIVIIAVLFKACTGSDDSKRIENTISENREYINISTTPTPNPTPTKRVHRNTPTPKPKLTPRDQFIQDSSEYLSADISGKLYDILINSIGFSDARFYGKLDTGDSIWEVHCDDMAINVVASDDVYRIWGGDFTFYENGAVVTTKQQMESTTISSSEQTSYYIIAQEIVSQNLKNPTSASFPSITFSPQEIAMQKKDNIVAVQSYVDAMNSFGATVRSQWTVEFRVNDLSSFSYETLYINIDGQSSGSYIDLG